MQGIATRRCQAWEKSIPTVEIWGKKLCLVIQAQNAAVNTSVKAFGWVKWVKGTCHPVPKQNCHKLHRQWRNSREKRTFICYNHMFIWASKHYPQCTFCFFLWENRQSIQVIYHYICLHTDYMGVVLLYSYDWSSTPIVHLTEQATCVSKTGVLISVESNLRFILPSLTHTFLSNKYKKLN